jgi:ribose transport system permease protein
MSVKRVNFGLDRFSGLYLWAAFIILFSILKPGLFPMMATVHSIAAQQAVSAILGMALVVPLAAGTYDLSVGATANLAAVIVIWLQSSQHWGVAASIVTALLAAAFVGVVNGFLVTRLRINSFIATLGMASIVSASQTIVSDNNQPVPPVSSTWSALTQQNFGGFQVVVIYVVVIGLFMWWALEHTPAGRYVYAVGSNPEAARLSGVRVNKWIWLSLITSGTLGGVAGVLYGSLSGPSLTFGQTLLLPAFAAAFLGSTQLKPGRFNIWGTVLAVYVLATGVQGLSFVTSAQWLSDMFNGVALIGAVWFAVSRQAGAASHPSWRMFRRRPAPPPGTPEPAGLDGEPSEVAGSPGT